MRWVKHRGDEKCIHGLKWEITRKEITRELKE
jgi:hypothetical protein